MTDHSESEVATPSDYDRDDGFDGELMLDQCPHCGRLLGGNGGYVRPVFDQNGQEYDSIYDTDPVEGPWFCGSCWSELDRNRKQSEHKTLEEYK